jgi:predicted enzyme related to lactoylglutathione lyase
VSARREYAAGEVCWADLQTRDVAAAKSFYAGVFGWRYEDLPTPDGRSYSKAFLDNDLVTVIAPQNPQQEASGAAAQWNVYFAADDAKAIAEEVPHAGGEVQFGPEAVADTGVMVFLGAPGGGTTGVWQAGTHRGAARSNEPGALAWAEFLTPEPRAAVGFFQQLFGHEVTEYPQDDGGTYTTLMVNGTEVAGIAPLAADDDGTGTDGTGTGRAQWQVYFGVSNVADAVDAAVAAGAVVLVEPEETPEEAPEDTPEDSEEAGIIATLQDPQGGVFSLVQV